MSDPLMGPAHFREFPQPVYYRVMEVARCRGSVLSMVNGDGHPSPLLSN